MFIDEQPMNARERERESRPSLLCRGVFLARSLLLDLNFRSRDFVIVSFVIESAVSPQEDSDLQRMCLARAHVL